MKPLHLIFLALGLAGMTPAAADPRPPQTRAEAQAAIWAKELAIYQARGRGDMGTYLKEVATDYAAWPPFRDTPAGRENLQAVQKAMLTDNKEILSMEYVSFVLNGDAAVIYYRTHRTRLPNGNPIDERFEVTHSWVWQDGAWKVMGGMARDTPVR